MPQVGAAGFYGRSGYEASSWNSYGTRVRSFELQDDDGYRSIRPVTYNNWKAESWQGEFHRQTNGVDCGPCMIANLNSALRTNHAQLKDVSAVRNTIDQFIRRTQTDPSRRLSLQNDIKPVLENFGFDIYTALSSNLYSKSNLPYKVNYDYVQDNFYQGGIAALICFDPQIEHFKAFVPNSRNSYINLDSTNPAPQLVEDRDISEVIAECAAGGPFGEFYIII